MNDNRKHRPGLAGKAKRLLRALLRQPIALQNCEESLDRIGREMRRQALVLGPDRALCPTVHGHMLFVDPRDLSLAPRLLMDGDWEPESTASILHLILPGMHVVEIGANIGWYSVLIAKRIGDAGRLHCYEPDAVTAATLRDNLEINGVLAQTDVRIKAVGDRPGQAEFHRFGRHAGSSSLLAPDAAQRSAFADSLSTFPVDVVRLDDEIPPGTRIDFIKIDAEGAEAMIWDGMQRVLRENPGMALLIEVTPAALAAQGRGGWIDTLRASGWSVHRPEPGGGASLVTGMPVSAMDLLFRRSQA